MSATKEQLIQVLDDVKALGYNLGDADDKAALYAHIVHNDSCYTLESGETIDSISLKYLFWLYHNNTASPRLAPKS